MLTRGKLAEDDLRLVALALIAETPRHGYDIIKTIEETTSDWHLPTPNIVYPMLNGLADSGYLSATVDPPKLYTITDDGRAYLEENRQAADAVLARLTALGERIRRWQEALGRSKQRKEPDEGNESLVEILARAELQRR